jgi:hypothetical protein
MMDVIWFLVLSLGRGARENGGFRPGSPKDIF